MIITFIILVATKYFTGHNLKLTEAEMKANEVLMASKAEEIGGAFENNLNFPPAKNFMTVIQDIEASSVFQFISRMPKGGIFVLFSFCLCVY